MSEFIGVWFTVYLHSCHRTDICEHVDSTHRYLERRRDTHINTELNITPDNMIDNQTE